MVTYSYVSYAFTDVAAIYLPITPSSTMAEFVDDMGRTWKKKNISDRKLK